MSLTVRVHLFGRYAELLGSEELALALPAGGTVSDAIEQVRQRPGGQRLPARPLAAVNTEHASDSQPLADGDELALLPPLAGG